VETDREDGDSGTARGARGLPRSRRSRLQRWACTALTGLLVLLPPGAPLADVESIAADGRERAHRDDSIRGGKVRPAGNEMLTESASCPLEVLARMAGRQISPRLAEHDEQGGGAFRDTVPARPESFRSQSSIIQKLENGMIRKILPVKPGESEWETRRRVLREAEFLGMLAIYRNFPRILAVDADERALYLEDCGRPLRESTVPCDWRRQMAAILQVLGAHGVQHNDWLGLGWPDTPNLTERDGILYLIDFSWATFGRDAYPFMNPTLELVYASRDMWQMLERTRGLHEARRLRYQHARDRHMLLQPPAPPPSSPPCSAYPSAVACPAPSCSWWSAAGGAWLHEGATAGAPQPAALLPRVHVARLLEKVGRHVATAPLDGTALDASAVAAESLRLLVTISEVHPWCLAHCGDCWAHLVVDAAQPPRLHAADSISQMNDRAEEDEVLAGRGVHEERRSLCESELLPDGVSFFFVTAVWDLKPARYRLAAGVSIFLAAQAGLCVHASSNSSGDGGAGRRGCTCLWVPRCVTRWLCVTCLTCWRAAARRD